MSAAVRIALWVSLALACATAALAQRQIEVYRPSHRVAEELLPIARTALGQAGVVTVDTATNALVIAGEPGAVAETVALLRQQDRALRNVLLRVAWRTEAELEAAGLEVAWTLDAGRVRIGNTRRPTGGTFLLGRLVGEKGTRETGFDSQVRVLDGQSAWIGMGRSVPVVTEGRYGDRTTTFVSGQRGFTATPRVLGDGRVRVTLDPVDERVDRGGRVSGASASTIVEVTPGQTAVIGGIDQSAASTRKGLSGAAHESTKSDRLLLLTAELPD